MYEYTVVEQELYKKTLKKLSKTYRNIDLDIKDFLTSIKTKEDLGIELKSNVFKVRVANSNKNKGKNTKLLLFNTLIVS
jgi:mRNA-degrading endonuclease RelE of RelBE toxin-antitoxin system